MRLCYVVRHLFTVDCHKTESLEISLSICGEQIDLRDPFSPSSGQAFLYEQPTYQSPSIWLRHCYRSEQTLGAIPLCACYADYLAVKFGHHEGFSNLVFNAGVRQIAAFEQ